MTLVWFQDKYYNYKGVIKEDGETEDKDENGSVVGALDAEYYVNVETTYFYEMYEEIIDKLIYAGTYRDDRLTIFQGQRS
eukprot:10224615-Ditylum_brightwellii.AAC.1